MSLDARPAAEAGTRARTILKKLTSISEILFTDDAQGSTFLVGQTFSGSLQKLQGGEPDEWTRCIECGTA